ncbi:hypothetical protein Zmor_006504 [Zophobas morio]|mgnify:CR=1 FL=1|uniref:Uncharacterized protein n=1 Tax=Zophobas morio TaxID=2755281 RepID=A0AA38IV06_9CUCU|nr:hypothetical protein Zmor_006504 [Zophobas morio]
MDARYKEIDEKMSARIEEMNEKMDAREEKKMNATIEEVNGKMEVHMGHRNLSGHMPVMIHRRRTRRSLKDKSGVGYRKSRLRGLEKT